MKVTVDLTKYMIAKLEAFRTREIADLERLMTSHDDVERVEFISQTIERYKIKPLDELLFSYLHE